MGLERHQIMLTNSTPSGGMCSYDARYSTKQALGKANNIDCVVSTFVGELPLKNLSSILVHKSFDGFMLKILLLSAF